MRAVFLVEPAASTNIQSIQRSQLGRKVSTNGWSRTNNLTSCNSAPRLFSGSTSQSHLLTAVSLVPTDEETAAGWHSRGRIADSPQVQSIDEIPSAGWDEWYIFDKPVDVGTSHLGDNIFEVPQEQGHLGVFVNYGFALHPPERKDKHLSTLFWDQIARIHPESYVADNDYLTFVSGNKTLFASVVTAVKALQ